MRQWVLFAPLPSGVGSVVPCREVSAYRITAADRSWYKRCRRAWDFGSTARRNLSPVDEVPIDGTRDAIGHALAVYYFPGMWAWPRDVVLPKVKTVVPQHAELIDGYAEWASVQDDFVPIQVATEIEVSVPDPVLSDRDLATVDGVPVRYCTVQDALVFGSDHRPWVLSHRFVVGLFTDPELLALDGAARTDCWAWRQLSLDHRIAGVIFNEIALDGRFRRTSVPYTAADLDWAGRHLALEALEMIDAGLALYPNPEPSICAACAFRRPCLVMQSGGDPGSALEDGFRVRPPAGPVEGRLGGRTWSTGRGARPPRFSTD